MAGVIMNIDGASLVLLTSPAVDVVLIALERHTIDDAGHRFHMRVLSLRCRGTDCNVDPSHHEEN
jgi:hypothetical protein